MEIKNKPTMLMILDGFGVSEKYEGNAIAQAKTPNFDYIFSTYPGTTLDACGMAVGLPEGQMGNSEVGHLNIGAGRVVYQELTHITKEIEEGKFFDNPALVKAMEHVSSNISFLYDSSIADIAEVAFIPSPLTKALYAFSTLSQRLSLSIA